MKCIQAGFVFAAGLGEIGELAHVVNLQVLRPLAYLAASGDEPVDQLVSPGTGHEGRWSVRTAVRARLSGIPRRSGRPVVLSEAAAATAHSSAAELESPAPSGA